MTGLLVEVDGAALSLADCSWVFRGACGCAYGVMSSVTPNWTCATEDQAWERFEPNRIQRERDRAAGDTATLLPRSAAIDSLGVGCDHDPRYGHPVTPVPEGYAWAAADGWKSRPRFTHLVPLPEQRLQDLGTRLYPYTHGKVAALCKRSTSRDWADDEFLVTDLPECSACQKAAAERAA